VSRARAPRSTATDRILSATPYSALEPFPKSPTTSATASSGKVVVGDGWVLVTGGEDDVVRMEDGDAEVGWALVVGAVGALQAMRTTSRGRISRLISSSCD